jgi:hypothetical protein
MASEFEYRGRHARCEIDDCFHRYRIHTHRREKYAKVTFNRGGQNHLRPLCRSQRCPSFPPYLRVVCNSLPKRIPRTLAGIPCRFTTNLNEIPLQGIFCRGPAISVGTICRPWILPPFDTRKNIAQLLVKHGVRSVGWLGTRWLLEVEAEDDSTLRNLPCKINGLVVSYRSIPPSKSIRRDIYFLAGQKLTIRTIIRLCMLECSCSREDRTVGTPLLDAL